MSRSIQILRRTRWLLLLAAMALPCVPTESARAGSYTYGSSQRTVNAGVLINGSAGSPAPDSAPYVFYLLNQRADVKPYGWNIVNPRAPSAITQDILARWAIPYTGPPYTSTPYTVGQSVAPYMAAYWEVALNDVSAEQLKQYDVLYLPFAGGIWLPENNEKLRHFVDGGGTLLIDDNGPNLASATLPYLLFSGAQFTAGAAQIGLPGGSLTLRHPLISRPFFLGADEILNLGIPSLSGGLTAATGDFKNLFTPVITHPASAAVSAAALGGGQIVASALDIGGAISSTESYPNFPYFGLLGISPDPQPNFSYAPAQDLKFLANVISLADMHPTESKSGHRNGVDNDLPSFAPAWIYPVGAAGGVPASSPPGAATWGGFAFVTDATGTLHAFDAFPQEDLTGTGGADDGVADYSQGFPYDEIWKVPSKSGAISAPTVGVLGGSLGDSFGGKTYVFVEDSAGNVLGYDPVTGALRTTIKPSSASSFSGFVPAPTVYGGRVYAGQSTGNLLVYDSNPGASASASAGVLIPLAGTEPVIAAPAVGIIPDGTANDIVALVPTTQNIYTVLLGARGDVLLPYPPNGRRLGYDLNFNKFRLNNLFADASSVPPSTAYNDSNVTSGTKTASGGKNPAFPSPSGSGTVYGNWDVDFQKSLPSSPGGATLTLNQISGASAGAATNNGITFTAGFSPTAMDRSGDFYYTDYASGTPGTFSYLVGVHNNVQFQNIRMKWRFRLPAVSVAADPTPLVDADGVNYELLRGYQFAGAPVADNQGYVYAIAASGGSAVVFCFLANGPVYADNITGFDVNNASFQQPDEFSPGTPNRLRPGPIDPNLQYGQFSAVGSQVTFFNFGIGANGVHELAGNLSEPQPVTVTPPLDPTTGVAVGAPATVPLHTNLVWMTAPFPVTGGLSGLSKVGNALFFADSVNLYKLSADLTPGPGKTVLVTPTALPTGVGAVSAAPAVGQGAMIVNGANGISAFTQQVTLVADNNRILETDSDGNALWSVDSTSHSLPAVPGGLPASITKVDFNHPTALSAVSANDYLVADTGNNRCVRFDRAGNVTWELTTFNDPNNLLTAGASTTLSQPASVQMRREADPVSGNILEHYLIADSGNYRVIEVTDTLAPGGQLITGKDHVLTFATHTYDKDNRRFRYGSATYFNTPPPFGLRVAALVTNARASLTAGGTALGPASNDSTGGTILVFDAVTGSATLGNVTAGFTSFQAGGTTYPMRNPRFLSLYQPPSAGAPFSFLYADDSGAFDFVYDPINKVFTTYSGGLAFSKGDYQSMNLPINGRNGTLSRAGLPFVPTCVQHIGQDAAGHSRYLITQSHSQGELGDPNSNAIGGEIFEVDYDTVSNKSYAVPTYNGGTLSRPTFTGPLTQPTFAIRP